MSNNPGVEIASAIQSASIQRNPDPAHDLNPSSSASKKEPVTIASSPASSDVADDEIPVSVLQPIPRKTNLPPLPDLRFEQSYLKSIEQAEGWGPVLYITVRDQVFLPLLQGTLWTLLVSGWHFWHRDSKFSGHNVGARLRRWWWSVNNWKIPTTKQAQLGRNRIAGDVREVSILGG
ncbi:DUF1770-domain-containing protein [Patellaria atrata CBS 101060]|uniref:DUF1770-domain-containing protein n=1 Tax=Patellaria atrata CBS 101060 TaxID=1346257 RepID=A0A9P4SJH2_9PEZI|nr:DUF1770-domain-containing protein [Patellaria atrata CBS 101060]